MCKVYNTVGSLTEIKTHLQRHNINEFDSIKQLLDFQKNYTYLQQKIVANHTKIVQTEIEDLNKEIPHLKKLIDNKRSEFEQLLSIEQAQIEGEIDKLKFQGSNIFQRSISFIKKLRFKRQLMAITRQSKENLTYYVEPLIATLSEREKRLHFISTNFDEAVKESSKKDSSKLNKIKSTVDQINNYIYGAIGEQKVVKELEKLSDQYVLINDFTLKFHNAIYRRQQDDYIKSIQIDHILISCAGIFLIETKYWSQQSMENLNLHSPVQQIKRTNYALYRVINEKISNSRLRINSHHWGDRKIPIRNLIVLINHKPLEEFQHVKILTLNEMLNYITYFQPSISVEDMKIIADELLAMNRKSISV